MEINEEIIEEKTDLTKKISESSYVIIINKLRANIELTAMADNKANVLLSLNALILTLLVPLLITHLTIVIEYNLYFPIAFFIGASLLTIYLAVTVLRPGKIGGQNLNESGKLTDSPFFYGNVSAMNKDRYLDYFLKVALEESESAKFLMNDYYHIALRLSEKMRIMRKAFNVFLLGIISSVSLALIFVLAKNLY